jgi:hypothetical protein
MNSVLSSLDGQLTALFSKVVRAKAIQPDGFIRCFICDTPITFKEAVLMHFQPRICKATRFHEQACQAGCSGCNGKDLGDRKRFAIRLNQKFGEGTSSRLTQISKREFRIDRFDYKAMIDHYKAEWKTLKKEHGL